MIPSSKLRSQRDRFAYQSRVVTMKCPSGVTKKLFQTVWFNDHTAEKEDIVQADLCHPTHAQLFNLMRKRNTWDLKTKILEDGISRIERWCSHCANFASLRIETLLNGTMRRW